MKHPRRWLAAVIPVTLLAIAGFLIFGSDRDDSPPSEEPVSEVVFLVGSEIPDLLANGRYAMIEFGGRSCIPCKKMQPILTELIAEHGAVIDIVNVYLDEDFAPADSFDVYLLPTQVIFDRNGEELSRHLGFWPKEEIEEVYRDLGIIE